MPTDIQVVVKAVDQFSAAMLAFEKSLKGQSDQAVKTEKAISGLSERLSGFGAVMTGALLKAGAAIFDAIASAVGRLASIIPDLIAKGQAWAGLIHDLQQETGMTAEQTSTLAAVFQHLGIGTDVLQRSFAMFGKNLASNEKLFASLGIATRGANGHLLDAYTILTNTRQAFSAHGDALTKTGAAQELFSRSGYKLLDFLNLTDAEFKTLAVDAANAGVVLNQAAVDAGERMTRTWAGLALSLQGVATQVFNALAPSLEAFVANFSAWVRANLDTIVRFIVTVANFVMGLVGGLLGINWSAKDATAALADVGSSASGAGSGMADFGQKAGGAAKGEDALTKSINASIAAIDRQIDVITRRQAARSAAAHEADLEKAIASAQLELANLQASALNTYGLSGAEQIKAQQKRQTDVLGAQQKVADAQKALADNQVLTADDAAKQQLEDQKKALQDQLAAHKQAQAAISAGVAAMGAGLVGTTAKFAANMGTQFDKFGKDAAAAMESGKKFAADLKTVFGNLVQWFADRAPSIVSVSGAFQWLGERIADFWRGWDAVRPLLDWGFAALSKQVSNIADAFTSGASIISGVVTSIVGSFTWLLAQLRKLPLIGQFIPGAVAPPNLAPASPTNPFHQTPSSAASPSNPLHRTPTTSTVTVPHGAVPMAGGGDLPFGQPAIVGERGIEGVSWTPSGIRVTPLTAGQTLPPVQLVIDGRVLMQWLDVQLGRRQILGQS